jgi:AAA domain
MTDYIIHLKQEDSHPLYLTEDEDPESVLDREPIIRVAGKTGKMHNYNVLNSHEWPNAEQLGLDSSQYTALEAALTKELAVIQGPPGTGKTFMALKIAEILITNKHTLGIKKPILVVSLTNHALDQFLVGMLKFTKNLVRIGGQSKSTELALYTLKSINIPRSHRAWELKNSLDAQRQQVANFQTRLNNVNSALACEGILTDPSWQDEIVDLQVWLLGPALSSLIVHFEQTYFSFENLLKFIEMCTQECLRFAHKNIESDKLKQKAVRSTNANDIFLKNELGYVESILTRFKEDYAVEEVDYQLATHPCEIKDDEEKLLCYFQMLKEEKLKLEKKVLQLQSNLSNKCYEYYEVKNMEKIEHLSRQDVIGLTTTGAARMHKMLGAIGCKIGIITLIFCVVFIYKNNLP